MCLMQKQVSCELAKEPLEFIGGEPIRGICGLKMLNCGPFRAEEAKISN
jgi:hypothetical protein